MDSSATEIRTGLQKNKEVRPQKGFGQKVNKHDSVTVGVREGGGGGGGRFFALILSKWL